MIDQSIDQSTNQSINHYVSKSVRQSISQSVSQSINPQTNQSINQSINWLTGKSIDQSIHQPTNQLSINQSINQFIFQSMGEEKPPCCRGASDGRPPGHMRTRQLLTWKATFFFFIGLILGTLTLANAQTNSEYICFLDCFSEHISYMPNHDKKNENLTVLKFSLSIIVGWY